jgi:hypothetical protein
LDRRLIWERPGLSPQNGTRVADVDVDEVAVVDAVEDQSAAVVDGLL